MIFCDACIHEEGPLPCSMLGTSIDKSAGGISRTDRELVRQAVEFPF